jgi:hypothetical protein
VPPKQALPIWGRHIGFARHEGLQAVPAAILIVRRLGYAEVASVSLWTFLFGKRGPNPLASIDDPTLGKMHWSEDDESWIGECGGYRFAVPYTWQAVPDVSLLVYVRMFLGEDGSTFTGNLNAARVKHAAEFERWEDEFRRLKVEMLRFGMSTNEMGCLVDLAGGEPDKSWRVEFDGHDCLGFGFDT